MREIEIKLKVKNLDELEDKLKKAGCQFSEPVSQHDIVYSDGENSGARPTGKAKEGHLAIRIRKEKGRSEFTLKKQKSSEMDNIEYETEVEKPEEIHGILDCLGWKPQLEVKKIRRKAKLGEYIICLDKVEHLGSFLEIEKMTTDDTDPNKVRNELLEAIKPFGLTEADEETRGYDTLIYQLKNK